MVVALGSEYTEGTAVSDLKGSDGQINDAIIVNRSISCSMMLSSLMQVFWTLLAECIFQ